MLTFVCVFLGVLQLLIRNHDCQKLREASRVMRESPHSLRESAYISRDCSRLTQQYERLSRTCSRNLRDASILKTKVVKSIKC